VRSAKCWTRSSAISVDTTKTTKSASPIKSKRKPAPEPVRRRRRKVSSTATTPRGRLTRNTERQPKCSVRKPPATGPNELAATATPAR
jgi:hypothetical protein